MTIPIHNTRQNAPVVFSFDISVQSALEEHLRRRMLLLPGESISELARAGDGNMNCTLRVSVGGRSFIVKQSRPWVEKYPQFAAPLDRAAREAEFYHLVAGCPALAGLMPQLLDFDPEFHVLVLEDLGIASDYSGLYRGETLAVAEMEVLAQYLIRLHNEFRAASGGPLVNREMRALNHAHIFEIPLAGDNGLDLDAVTPGLAEAARELRANAEFLREVRRLGREAYLADGPCLLHGDFFPGSILRTPVGPRVIDPEFAYFGRPEFDVAVFAAHLLLANQPEPVVRGWLRTRTALADHDLVTLLQLTGVEIMRRLIGYAQLPLGYGLRRKQALLRLAQKLVLQPCPTLLAQACQA